MRKTWHVRIPATTANLGAGFDSLGMALTIYNDFYFTADSQVDTITVTVSGKGEGTLSGDFSRNLIGRAMQYAATAKHTALPSGGHLRAVNRIPLNRGLGSSSTAIVGGLLLGDAVTEGSLSTQELLDLATLMEGHPDNVAPAILGGLTVSIQENKRIFCQKLPFPEALQAVVVVPEAEVPTAAARKVLPKQVPHAAAAYNAGRVGFFLASLWAQQYDQLQYGMQDMLHVPYRLPLIPGGKEALQAALAAGAKGATISGSGSTLIAIATANAPQIAAAMAAVFASYHIRTESHILHCDEEGARISTVV